MQAEVIAIGDELTTGQRLDTNSQWLSTELGLLGIPVLFHTTVCDTLEAGTDAFRIAAARCDLVVATGGLGPTADDLTRDVLAAVSGQRLDLSAAALEAEALAIKEGVLLRACYAAKPCGGRGGGEKRFGKWFVDEEGGEEEEEEQGGGASGNVNATLPSSSPSPSNASASFHPLHKRCFVSAAGWWLYEVCVGGGIRQFHPPTSPRDAPAANSLGTFSGASSSSSSSRPSEPAPPRRGRRRVEWLSAAELYRGAPLREEAVDGDSRVFPFVEQRYEGGDPCGESEEEEQRATAVRRSATLRLVCPSSRHAATRDIDSVPRLLIAEPETCVYVLTLFHPEACALVNEGGGGAAAEEETAEAASVAKEEEQGEAAVSVETTAAAVAATATSEEENVAAAAAAPPEAAAAPAVPLPSHAVPPPPPPAAHDEL